MKYSNLEVRCLKYLVEKNEIIERVDWSDECLKMYAAQKGYKDGFCVVPSMTQDQIKSVHNRRQTLLVKLRQMNLRVVNDQLVSMCIINNEIAKKVVVAEDEIPLVLRNIHDQNGHIGVTALTALANSQYIGIDFQSVRAYVATCRFCSTRKVQNKRIPHTTPIKIYNNFERVGADLVKFNDPRTGQGKYLLTIIDYFSRFAFAYWVDGAGTAQEIAKLLTTLFRRLGLTPLSLQTDNGAQFTADVIVKLMKELKVKIVRAMPNSPETGGRFERLNATLPKILEMVIMQAQQDGEEISHDEALEKALYVYNNKPHTTLSYKGNNLTPAEVFYPGVTQRLRATQMPPPISGANYVLEDTTQPPPMFEEKTWDTMMEQSAHNYMMARENVSAAEIRISNPTYSKPSSDRIVVGCIGTIDVPRQHRKKGGILNAPCIIREVFGNKLRVELLNENFEASGQILDHLVHVSKFVPGSQVPQGFFRTLAPEDSGSESDYYTPPSSPVPIGAENDSNITDLTEEPYMGKGKPQVKTIQTSLRSFLKKQNPLVYPRTSTRCMCRKSPCDTNRCRCYAAKVRCGVLCVCRRKHLKCHNQHEKVATVTSSPSDRVQEHIPSPVRVPQPYNTCYMSAVLTLVQHFPWMANLLRRKYPSSSLVGTLQQFFAVLASSKGKVTDETDLLMAKILSAMEWEKGDERGVGRLNDAMEFYQLLIQHVIEDLQKTFPTAVRPIPTELMLPEVQLYSQEGDKHFLRHSISEVSLLVPGMCKTLEEGIHKALQGPSTFRNETGADIKIPLVFPANLVTSPILEAPENYHLVGALLYNHNSMHYTALSVDHGEWNLYNGPMMQKVSGENAQVLLDQQAYGLFYKKVQPLRQDRLEEANSRQVGENRSEQGNIFAAEGHIVTEGDHSRSEEQRTPHPNEQHVFEHSYSRGLPHGLDVLSESDMSRLADPDDDTIPFQPPSPVQPHLPQRESDDDFDMPDIPPPKQRRKTSRRIKTSESAPEKAGNDKQMPQKKNTVTVQDQRKLMNEDLKGLSEDQRKLMKSLRDTVCVSSPNVSWSEVCGLDALKQTLLMNILLPMQQPHLFKDLTPALGFLLYGPPGTGKTLTARAIASEAKLPILVAQPCNIIDKYIGNSSQNARLLFKLARNRAPCIVFIDEIDALMSSRSSGDNEERRALKTQLLQEIDGFVKNEKPVYLIAATNCPWDLDAAMMRRLPVRVYVSLPKEEDRQKLLRHFLFKGDSSVFSYNIDINELAKATEGYSTSELECLCSHAKRTQLAKALQGVGGERVHVKVHVHTNDVVNAMQSVPKSCTKEHLKKYSDFLN